MSLFETTELACPSCGTHVLFEMVHSVNADRRPDLRAAILNGTFQLETCPSCGKAFRTDPKFTYLNLAKDEWIAVYPDPEAARWRELEEEVQALYDESFGAGAPAAARALAKDVRPRLVFGWGALCEKLRAQEDGLDDVELELLKIGLLRNLETKHYSLEMETELRFVSAVPAPEDAGEEAEDTLSFAWMEGGTSEVLEALSVPRSLYDEIRADNRLWAKLRYELSQGIFVDMERLVTIVA